MRDPTIDTWFSRAATTEADAKAAGFDSVDAANAALDAALTAAGFDPANAEHFTVQVNSSIGVLPSNPQGSIKEMLDLVVGTDSGIKFIYKGKTSGNEVECYLTTQDLKDILNGGGASADSSDEKKLEEQVKMTNVSCPMQVDEATMLNKLTIESDKVLYHYTIDESVVQMSALKENAEQMKANVKNSLNSSDPALRMFLEVCVKCDKGVGYLYKGNKSGETFEISFGVSEIKALL